MQVALKPLQHISPSLFSALKGCRLRAVWVSNHVPNLLPISPSSRLGMVVHRIIEMSGHSMGEDAFQKLWDCYVHDQEAQMGESWFERHLLPLSTTALDFHVKKSQCFLLLQARDNISQTKELDASRLFREQWLRSSDGLVVGRADLIKFTRAGVAVVDYKTGNVSGQSTDSEVIPEYNEQLKLYAALFYEECGEWPNNLIIISLDGKSHYIEYEKNECLILLEESKNMLRQVNSIIEADRSSSKKAVLKLASPSQTNCQYCLYRPICEPYFLARQDNSTEGWPNDTWGTVAEKKRLGNGLWKIVLTSLSSASLINVRGLRLERHSALNIFQKVGVFSLYSDSSNNNYKEGPFTTIYGI